MFKGLKQKIAQGQEGVSPGRQTPLRPKREVGKAQAQNNGILEQTAQNNNSTSSTMLDTSGHEFSVPKDEGSNRDTVTSDSMPQLSDKQKGNHSDDMDSTSFTSLNSPGPLPSFQQIKDKLSPLKQYFGSEDTNDLTTATSSLPETPRRGFHVSTSNASTPVDSEPDLDAKFDQMSREDVVILIKKQVKTLGRYKAKFSELVDAYKVLQKEKEKLENTLTSGQDKHLRRISELKETVELEKKAKEHLEETLRMTMDEKDQLINVLQTQVQLLKKKKDQDTHPDLADIKLQDNAADRGNEIVELRATLESQRQEVEKLRKQSKDAKDVIVRLESEKKTAIEEMLGNLQTTMVENNDLKTETVLLKDELGKKSSEIERMRKEMDQMRQSITEELRSVILEEAVLRQEQEIKAVYLKKEEELKANFTEKVREIQNLVEEKESQKQDIITEKGKEISRLKDTISTLEEETKRLTAAGTGSKNRTKKLVSEKEEWEKKFYEVNQKLEQEKARIGELVQQHNGQLKEKQEELQQQMQKSKRSTQAKIHELQESVKIKEKKITEMETKLENSMKETELSKQAELAKVSKTCEAKVAEIKKVHKDLRGKLSEKEEFIGELEQKLINAGVENNTALQNIKELEYKVSSLQKEMLDKDSFIRSLEAKISEERSEADRQIKTSSSGFAEKEASFAKDLENLNFVLHSKEKLLKELQQSLDAKEGKILDMQRKESEAESLISSLQRDVDDRNENISRLENANSKLEVDAKSLESRLLEEQEKLSQSNTARLKEMENAFRTEIDKLNASHATLVKELQTQMTTQVNVLQEQVRASKKELDALESVKNENKILKISTKELEESRHLLQSTLNDLKHISDDQIVALNKECKQLKAEVSKCQSEAKKTQLNQESKTEKAKALEEQVSALSLQSMQDTESFQKELESKTKIIEELTTALEKEKSLQSEGMQQVGKKIALLESEKSDITQKYNENCTLLEGKGNLLLQREVQLQEQETRLMEMEKKHQEQLTCMRADYEQHFSKMQQKLQQTVDNQKQEQKDVVTAYDKKLKTISDQLLAEQRDYCEKEKRLCVEMAALRTAKEDMEANVGKERLSFQNQILELQHQLDDLNASHTEESTRKAEELIMLHEQLSRKDNELLECRKVIDHLTAQASLIKKSESERLQTEHSQGMERSVDNIEKEYLQKLNDCTNSWKNKCDELEKKYRKIIGDKEKKRKEEAQKSNQTAREQLAHLEKTHQDRIADVMKEMEKLRNDKDETIHSLQKELTKITEECSTVNGKVESLEKLIQTMKQNELCNTQEIDSNSQLAIVTEQHKAKLHDMKRKAETKIAAVKKNYIAQLEEKDIKIMELEQILSSATSTQVSGSVSVSDKESSGSSGPHALEVEVKEKENKIYELEQDKKVLEEKLENSVVIKMQALKTLECNIKEEHDIAIKKLKQESDTKLKSAEEKLLAKIDEKEFEYSARVKQIVKEFQAKLNDKDKEIHDSVEQAVEKGQKEERRIIEDYEDQIREYKRELKLREDDMKKLKQETDCQLSDMKNDLHASREQSKQELYKLETEYHERINDMVRRQENELQMLKGNQADVAVDQKNRHDNQLAEMEKVHQQKMQELENHHHSEKVALEKKLKTQMKRNQTEMKKLLADKGALKSTRGDDVDVGNVSVNVNPNVDIHPDAASVMSLKEKVATMEKELIYLRGRENLFSGEVDSRMSEHTNQPSRPATLELYQSPGKMPTPSSISPPKTPEPVQFEYLRNILFEYMMGRQTKQLSKVLAAIVHFSPSQVQQIVEREEQSTPPQPGLFG